MVSDFFLKKNIVCFTAFLAGCLVLCIGRSTVLLGLLSLRNRSGLIEMKEYLCCTMHRRGFVFKELSPNWVTMYKT